MNSRYDNRPLVMLLDKYVLWSIGALPDREAATLQAMTPQLGRAFSAQGRTWQEVVAAAMEFPPDMPATFRDMWTRNLDIARQHGETLDPQRFAEMIVDENFPV